MKILIADVLYTSTDETYYVLRGESRYANEYKASSLTDFFTVLKADGWDEYGKTRNSDSLLVDMFKRDGELIAVWQEQKLN